ncbi:MAG: phosphatase PAP2 family protein [Chloroflexi bacterium]|nr:phosphatase PAP2 family protein [Chloroflexota bacterium]
MNDRQTLKRLTMLAVLLLLLLLYFPINQNVTGGITPNLPIDALVPLWPIWAIPYLLTIPWWILSLAWGALKMDYPRWRQFSLCLGLTIIISYLFFIIYPTYVVRPEITDQDFLSQLVVGIYGSDQAHNALPSGHTYTTLIISIFWSQWLPKLKPVWIVIAVLVLLSTLFTKQHYLLDLLAAAGLVVMTYFLSGYLLRKND